MASRWVSLLVDVVRAVVEAGRATPSRGDGSSGPTTADRAAQRRPTTGTAPTRQTPAPAPPATGGPAKGAAASDGYPGDYRGRVRVTYDPHPDGSPDPGEIVWTWVPYEEDHHQGKDRPVLLVGRDGEWLLALQLTSKDHDRDLHQEAREGRLWMDIGTGPWDKQGRPSEVRLNRVIRVAPDAVRREGAVMAKTQFLQITAAMAKALG